MKIAFYGSSLLSSYWNGAATYYRGLLRELATFGHDITFFEPDAFDRQKHRDFEVPDWCRVFVYEARPDALSHVIAEASDADAVIKASGVGYEDEALLTGLMLAARPDALRIFWDVDAPATLAEMAVDPEHYLRTALSDLDLVLTYGGGDPVVRRYREMGARSCVPIYNALDPTTHYPVDREPRFACDLAFLGNRLPDREARVNRFFFEPARRMPDARLILGGSGWEGYDLPGNVTSLGHVSTHEHNAFNSTPKAVLNISRESMATMGFSPATRVFEAAGAGACLISDDWQGLGLFLTPDVDVLVARDTADVVEILAGLDPEKARRIGRSARAKVLRNHTYDQRAALADKVLREALSAKRAGNAA
jgi:spore maturation protein CgeB